MPPDNETTKRESESASVPVNLSCPVESPTRALGTRYRPLLSPHGGRGARPYTRPVANGRAYAPTPQTGRYAPILQTIVNQTESRSIPRSDWNKEVVWAYGVTTIPERNPEPLHKTLASLRASGFNYPTVFVDGDKNWTWWEKELNLPVVCRYPRIRTYGNWILTLAELYIRNPDADLYAIFQDDLICSKNLRKYLESVKYPEKGYWNLYTFPQNYIYIRDTLGFSPAKGWRGAGAVGLVFNCKAVQTLLSHDHMVRRAKEDGNRRWRYVDGGVVEAMNLSGWTEYVHNPSLLQHTGLRSTSGNPRHPQAQSFRGEDYDLMELFNESPRR